MRPLKSKWSREMNVCLENAGAFMDKKGNLFVVQGNQIYFGSPHELRVFKLITSLIISTTWHDRNLVYTTYRFQDPEVKGRLLEARHASISNVVTIDDKHFYPLFRCN